MSLKYSINIDKLPRHIAIIMDGNGRWAKDKGMARIFGHRNGVKAVREATEAAAELGVQYLTLYAFSTENWSRPQTEVNALMTLLVDTIKKEIKTLMENNIRLLAIGDVTKLPKRTFEALNWALAETQNNTRMCLILALNYSARWELTKAMKHIAEDIQQGFLNTEDITAETISSKLATANIPDPDLLLRTSGEYRISNFLLWQIAYSELYFTPVLWPDFRREHLYEAIIDYQKRERRYGKTSEQVKI
jgi:undecaprenyl diphosphate synthase